MFYLKLITNCVLFSLISAAGISLYSINFKELQCKPNSLYVSDIDCKIIKPENRQIQWELTFIQRIPAFVFDLTVYVPNSKKQLTKMIDLNFDLCKALYEKSTNKILGTIYQNLAHRSNMPARCPFEKTKYYFYNISGVSGLPPILRESDFYVHFNFIIPKVATLVNVTINGRLTKSRRF